VYRGRWNLVLYFSHGPGCLQCQNLTEELASLQDDFDFMEARLLVIWPVAMEDLPDSKEYPFPVLADPDGEVRRTYAEYLGIKALNEPILLVVLDRFGAPYAAAFGEEVDPDSAARETLDWLDYIGLQCPE
jgi:peroxiredoxin